MNFKLTTLASACLILTACGGGSGGGSSTPAQKTGQLIDSTVQGAAVYVNNKKIATTDKDGKFTYPENATVTFKVGNVTLGSVNAPDIVTPADLATDIQGITNIAQLLQSLDSDQNPANGIVIPETIAAKLKTKVDLSKPKTALTAIEQDLKASNIKFVPATNAMSHLTQTIGRLQKATTPEHVKSAVNSLVGFWQSDCIVDGKTSHKSVIRLEKVNGSTLKNTKEIMRRYNTNDCSGQGGDKTTVRNIVHNVIGVAKSDGKAHINLITKEANAADTLETVVYKNNAFSASGNQFSLTNKFAVTDGKTTTPVKQPTTPVVATDLEQAKGLIDTARVFVGDAKAVQTSYENVADIITDKQSKALDSAMAFSGDLFDYMVENNKTRLTTSEINALSGKGNFTNQEFSASTGTTVSKNSEGEVILNGTVSITPITVQYGGYYDGVKRQWVNDIKRTKGVATTSTFTNVKIKSLQTKASTGTSANIYTYAIPQIKIGTGTEAMTLTAATDGLQFNATFNKSVSLDGNSSLDKIHATGAIVTKARLSLKELKLEANKNTIALKNLTAEAMDFDLKLKDGKGTQVQSLPTKLTIEGQLINASPKTDISIKLNAAVDTSSITTALNAVKDSNGDTSVEEITGKYVKGTVMLTVKGSVTKSSNVVIPLDFTANLSRTGTEKVTLDKLTATVNGRTITMTGESNSVNDKRNNTLKFAQNKASVSVNLSDNQSFESAPIVVNGKTQGTLYKSSNGFQAKFIDNSIITF